MIQKLIEFFFGKREVINTGAIGDTRTDLQKEGAYDARELTTSSQVEWKIKTKWNSYPVKRQFYTFQCVAHSIAKHLGINHFIETGEYKDLSAEFIYQHRENQGTGGMNWGDAMRIAITKGSCLNSRIPQRIRESDPPTPITAEMINEALKYRGKAFIEDKERTLESTARIIQSQGSCMMWFYFDEAGKEWWTPEPKIIYDFKTPYDKGTTRHAVIGTDNGIRKDKMVDKIEDSAGNGSAENDQDRFIDADFMKRCFVAGYIIDLPNEIPTVKKIKWTGTRNLKVGDKGEDVNVLQQILMNEGCYKFDVATGYFGGITKAGVIALQEKYKTQILVPAGLTKGTGIVGIHTLNWLKNNYNV